LRVRWLGDMGREDARSLALASTMLR